MGRYQAAQLQAQEASLGNRQQQQLQNFLEPWVISHAHTCQILQFHTIPRSSCFQRSGPTWEECVLIFCSLPQRCFNSAPSYIIQSSSTFFYFKKLKNQSLKTLIKLFNKSNVLCYLQPCVLIFQNVINQERRLKMNQ